MAVTVKLVVIGAAGVGKTSLRGQYISGRFSTGYRATIGADFITKVLPHPTKQDETVTLQIWDTAGQERFSSLSSAFFRGADAAILMFDVNSPETMEALSRWWEEFKRHAPVYDEEMDEYCCVVVGNKVDLVRGGLDGRIQVNGNSNGNADGARGKFRANAQDGAVTKEEAEEFLRRLVPTEILPEGEEDPLETPQVVVAPSRDGEDEEDDPLSSSQLTARPISPSHPLDPNFPSSPDTRIHTPPPPRNHRSNSITIIPHPLSRPHSPLARLRPHNSLQTSSPSSPTSRRRFSQSKSRSRSAGASSRLSASAGGTMTTMHSGLSVYHTPSSSLFDQFESARSSPEMWESSYGSYPPTSVTYNSKGGGASPSIRGRSLRMPGGRRLTVLSNGSTESTGSESASTVTPSVYAREHHEHEDENDSDAERSHGRLHSRSFLNEGTGTVASSVVSFVSALSGRSSFVSQALTSTSTATTPDNDLDSLEIHAQAKAKAAPTLSPPDYGPKLFFTSAKTGEGVKDVFEYVARRVVRRWEWEERREASRLEMGEGSEWGSAMGPGARTRARRDATVQLRKEPSMGRGRKWGECCAS